jgi:large subunit ribosomal protein L9
MMKVILRTDIDNLGKIGELVSVKPGYARNYLVPQGFAYTATPGALRRFEEEKLQLVSAAERERSRADALRARIESHQYKVEMKTGEQGRLYGSVTAQTIADLLHVAGIEIDRRRIRLDQPIKALGEFFVPIKLYGDISAQARVLVTDADALVRAAIEAEVAASEALARGEVPATPAKGREEDDEA